MEFVFLFFQKKHNKSVKDNLNLIGIIKQRRILSMFCKCYTDDSESVDIQLLKYQPTIADLSG